MSAQPKGNTLAEKGTQNHCTIDYDVQTQAKQAQRQPWPLGYTQQATYLELMLLINEDGVSKSLQNEMVTFICYFKTVDSTRAGADTAWKYGGTGLGSAICKQLASRDDQACTSDCHRIIKTTLLLEGNIADDVPIEVIGDVLRIRQILTNLIKYGLR
ncbi:hypothetical protein Tco_0665381 [Tanacetum coccineum]